MRVSFRQGIISAYSPFLSVVAVPGGNAVRLDTIYKDLYVTFSHGPNAEYLFVEPRGMLNTSAWLGPFTNSTNYWLYWDIDTLTGIRTFGSTLTLPITAASAPSSPATDQHWFDSTNKIQYVWTGTRWKVVIRAFAAKLINGTTLQYFPVGSSQGNVTVEFASGRILFDSHEKAIRKHGGIFLTSEDNFFTAGSLVNVTKLENNVVFMHAGASIAPNSVVKLSALNIVIPALGADAGNALIGFSPNAAAYGEIVPLVLQGVITNPDWTWTTAGAPLYINELSVLDTIDPFVVNSGLAPRPPVARIIDTNTIFFNQSIGGKGETGVAGASNMKLPARAATTANVSLSNAGATIDGITLAVNDRVLVKNQTTGSQNGIYTVVSLLPTVLNRSFDANVDAEMKAALFIFVEEGINYGDTGWILGTDNPITLGVTPLTFVLIGTGVNGKEGLPGLDGASGWSGFSGKEGLPGFDGASGHNGADGMPGLDGASGWSGFSGFSGFTGRSGFSGYTGISGFSGYTGISGFSGIGTSGFSGLDGAAASSGFSGYSGQDGAGNLLYLEQDTEYFTDDFVNGNWLAYKGDPQSNGITELTFVNAGADFFFVYNEYDAVGNIVNDLTGGAQIRNSSGTVMTAIPNNSSWAFIRMGVRTLGSFGSWNANDFVGFQLGGATGGYALLDAQNIFLQSQQSLTATMGMGDQPDGTLGNNFRYTVTGTMTLANPQNVEDGTVFNIFLRQNGTGGHVVSFDTWYKFPTGVTPSVSLAANSMTMITGIWNNSETLFYCNIVNF